MTLGERLIELRDEKTLAEVASATGIGVSTLSGIERDSHGTTLWTLCALAKFYGIRVIELLAPVSFDDEPLMCRIPFDDGS